MENKNEKAQELDFEQMEQISGGKSVKWTEKTCSQWGCFYGC